MGSPGPGGGCLLRGGRNEEAREPGSIPSCIPSQGAARRIQGRVGFAGCLLEEDCFSLSCLVREGLACTGRVAPNNSRGGGEGGETTILSQKRRNEAFLFNLLFWDMTDASSTCCHLRIAGLERSHPQPNPDGAAAEPGLRWRSGPRRVPVPPPSYIMGSRVVVRLRRSVPLPAAALGVRELKP